MNRVKFYLSLILQAVGSWLVMTGFLALELSGYKIAAGLSLWAASLWVYVSIFRLNKGEQQ